MFFVHTYRYFGTRAESVLRSNYISLHIAHYLEGVDGSCPGMSKLASVLELSEVVRTLTVRLSILAHHNKRLTSPRRIRNIKHLHANQTRTYYTYMPRHSYKPLHTTPNILPHKCYLAHVYNERFNLRKIGYSGGPRKFCCEGLMED